MTMKSLKDLKNANGFGETIKLGCGLAIGFAADMAVTALLKGRVPMGKGLTRLMMKLGIFAIGMKVGEDVENYFYKVCGDTQEAIESAKTEAMALVEEAKAPQ